MIQLWFLQKQEPMESPQSVHIGPEPRGIFLLTSVGFGSGPKEQTMVIYQPAARINLCLCPYTFPSCQHSKHTVLPETSNSSIYWLWYTCSFNHRVSVSQNHNIVSGKSGFEYFLFAIICVSKWVLHNLCQCLNKEQT